MSASELVVSKMENFRKFIFSHPYLPFALEEMSLLDRIQFESMRSIKLDIVTIMDIYKQFLVRNAQEKESPLTLYEGKWTIWTTTVDIYRTPSTKLAAIKPEKTQEEWENQLINDLKKFMAYLNLIHDFYIQINSSS